MRVRPMAIWSGLAAVSAFFPLFAASATDCIKCHDENTPAIVMDWRNSKHSQEDVSCDGCHKGPHRSRKDIDKLLPVTAQTCSGCHEKQMIQFSAGKHAKAWTAHEAMPTAHALQMTLGPGMRGCSDCHKIGLKDEQSTNALKAQGSVFGHASCDGCHTRHTFSVMEARQPQACQTCHTGFDHPQWEMFSASKHGVRTLLKQSMVLPGNVAGPSCQDCHMAGGDHEVRTAWGFFGVRLPLPDDPQWRADQATILQALGVIDGNGKPTLRLESFRENDVARLTQQGFDQERERMISVCDDCHSGNLARAELRKGDEMIREADHLFAEAIRIVAALYADGVLQRPPGQSGAYPDLLAFPQAPSRIEQRLFRMHLEHRMRVFQGTFHSNPNYALTYGWSGLVQDLQDIREMAAELRARKQR
jgi:hypothetical protein